MKNTAPAWLIPVVAIFTLQTLASFLSRLIPIVGPAMAGEFGWNGSSIGYLSAGNALGGVAILVAGSSMLKRIGGTRVLQIALFTGAGCMGLFLYPSLSIALLACFIMGTSNGAANPAGSEVLQRFSPPGMRNLLFSIKQAGVPLGGMMAGLLVPLLIALSSWRIALVACVLIVVLPTALTWRLSDRLDERKPLQPAQPSRTTPWHALRKLGVPLASLRHSRNLLRMAIVGSLFAIPQSCWFTFTAIYLVERLNYSLTLAGLVFAVMQVGGVLGRVTLGWLADHLRSATATLSVAALFSALTTALLGIITPQWPLWSVIVLAFIAGCTAASWNGVQIAEVARRSPPHLIAETTSGSSLLVSLVNVVAPTAFALVVAGSGRYDLAFIFAGACALLVLVVLPRGRD